MYNVSNCQSEGFRRIGPVGPNEKCLHVYVGSSITCIPLLSFKPKQNITGQEDILEELGHILDKLFIETKNKIKHKLRY